MFSRGFGGENHCPWLYGGFFHSGWGLLMMAGILLTAGILIFLIWKNHQKKERSNGAVEQLKIRYANSEINEEEYRQKKQVLENKSL